MGTIEGEESLLKQFLVVFLLALRYLLLGLGQELCCQLALNTEEFLHQWLVFLKHLIFALGYRTADNQRGTGIVDQHGVDLVDDGIVMGTLYQVSR